MCEDSLDVCEDSLDVCEDFLDECEDFLVGGSEEFGLVWWSLVVLTLSVDDTALWGGLKLVEGRV